MLLQATTQSTIQNDNSINSNQDDNIISPLQSISVRTREARRLVDL